MVLFLHVAGSQSFFQTAHHADGVCWWTSRNAALRFLHPAEDMGGTTRQREQNLHCLSLVHPFMSLKRFYVSLSSWLHQFMIGL